MFRRCMRRTRYHEHIEETFVDNGNDMWHADLRGWIICVCVGFVGVIGMGIMTSFGVFIVAFKAEYHTSLVEQNLIAAVPMFMSLFMAPFCVTLIRRLNHHGYRWGSIIGIIMKSVSSISSSFVPGPRWLWLTYCFIFGAGDCLVFMASALVLADHFDPRHRHHVLATSTVRFSVPLGILLFNPINAALIARFQWRATLRINSVPLLVLGVLLSWPFAPKLKRSPTEDVPFADTDQLSNSHEKPREVEEGIAQYWSVTELKQRPEIALWYLGNSLISLGWTLPVYNLPFYMTLRDTPPTESAWILTMMGVTELFVYVVGSLTGDRLRGHLLYVNITASAALTLLYLLVPTADVSYGSTAVIMIAIAVFMAMSDVYQYAASKEVTGLSSDKAWVCTNFWGSFGMIIGPPFFGFVYDTTGNFDNVFYVAGVCFGIQTTCFALIEIIKRMRCETPHCNGMEHGTDDSQLGAATNHEAINEYGSTDTTAKNKQNT